MISIAMTSTGAGTVTPPASGLCRSGRADRVVRMAPFAAPFQGTGVPTAGSPVRLRGLIAAAGSTGTAAGAFPPARPSVPTTARQAVAVAGATTEHTSSTPGDLPPEDPLS